MQDNVSKFLADIGIKHSDDLVTNSTAVIVAIPKLLDPIRLIGDEEKHATMLFFGETSTLPPEAKDNITETLALAASLFGPFREDVIGVSRLGSDNPPALVAGLSGNFLSRIRDILMVNPKINEYMGNAQQFPSYTPHVTLGYPDFAGEAELRQLAMNLDRVCFDRISLWWNDERIDYDLTTTPSDASECDNAFRHAYAEVPSDNVVGFLERYGVKRELKHHGVKGQKWGVRRETDGGGGSGGAGGVIKRFIQRRKVTEQVQKAPVGSIAINHKSDGSTGYAVKRPSGKWEKVELSEDAANFVKASTKGKSEMSNHELQQFIARAGLLKQYDDLGIFKKDGTSNKPINPNQELKDKVENLELHTRLRDAQARLRPPGRVEKVAGFVKKTAPIYDLFTKLDKFTGNTVSKQLTAHMQEAFDKNREPAGKSTFKSRAIEEQQIKNAGKEDKSSKKDKKNSIVSKDTIVEVLDPTSNLNTIAGVGGAGPLGVIQG